MDSSIMVAMDRALRWDSVEAADTMAADMVEAADTMVVDMVVEGAIIIKKQQKPAAMRAFYTSDRFFPCLVRGV
jgi:hypothetical protein